MPGDDRENPGSWMRSLGISRAVKALYGRFSKMEEAERPGFVGAATMEMPVGKLARQIAERKPDIFAERIPRGEKDGR